MSLEHESRSQHGQGTSAAPGGDPTTLQQPVAGDASLPGGGAQPPPGKTSEDRYKELSGQRDDYRNRFESQQTKNTELQGQLLEIALRQQQPVQAPKPTLPPLDPNDVNYEYDVMQRRFDEQQRVQETNSRRLAKFEDREREGGALSSALKGLDFGVHDDLARETLAGLYAKNPKRTDLHKKAQRLHKALNPNKTPGTAQSGAPPPDPAAYAAQKKADAALTRELKTGAPGASPPPPANGGEKKPRNYREAMERYEQEDRAAALAKRGQQG